MWNQSDCLFSGLLYAAYSSVTDGMSLNAAKWISSMAEPLLPTTAQYTASSATAIHAYPLRALHRTGDSSLPMSGAVHAMWSSIEGMTLASMFVAAWRALPAPLGDLSLHEPLQTRLNSMFD